SPDGWTKPISSFAAARRQSARPTPTGDRTRKPVTDLRYPIGPFEYDGRMSDSRRAECVARIAAAPGRLRAAVTGLDDTQLDTPYRPGGWTVRQLVHHIADSHMNSFMRWRLALTEPEPTIRPYDQAAWGE